MGLCTQGNRKRFDLWYIPCQISCHEERVCLAKRSELYCDAVVCSQSCGCVYTIFQKQNNAPPRVSNVRRTKYSQSYTEKQTSENIAVVGNKIKLLKLGLVQFAKSREVEGRIVNATGRRNPSGRYFVSLLVETEVKELPRTQSYIGMDVG